MTFSAGQNTKLHKKISFVVSEMKTSTQKNTIAPSQVIFMNFNLSNSQALQMSGTSHYALRAKKE